MSLLSFAMDFGAGATASLAQSKAEERKVKLEKQRQANLARLQAQYATEEKFEAAGRIADLAISADPRDQAKAVALGYKPPQPKDDRTALQKNIDRMADAKNLPLGSREREDFVARVMERAVGSPTTNIFTHERAEDRFRIRLAEQDVEQLGEVETRASRAIDQLAQVDRIQAALESGEFTTGSASGIRFGFGRWAVLLGMDPSAIPLIGNPVTADTIESSTELIAANLVGDITSNAAMRGSVALLEMARDAGPRLSRTPEGNAILAEVLRRKSEREIEVSLIAQEYARMGTFRPEGRPSFNEAVIELNRTDPIITEELRQRIISARDNAPTSQEMASRIKPEPPRVDFVADASSNLTPDQVNAKLDALGVNPGDKFIDARGRTVTRPRR